MGCGLDGEGSVMLGRYILLMFYSIREENRQREREREEDGVFDCMLATCTKEGCGGSGEWLTFVLVKKILVY